MGGLRSRRKGKCGEREAAEMLTELFYSGGSGRFRRTPMSGAWGGSTVMSGDVVPIFYNGDFEVIDNRIPFYFEVKRVESVSLEQLVAGELCFELYGWLRKAFDSCRKSSYIPLVIWRKNYMEWMVLMTEYDWNVLREWLGFLPKKHSYIYSSSGFTYSGHEQGWVCMPFRVFASWVRESGVLSELMSSVIGKSKGVRKGKKKDVGNSSGVSG